MRPGKLHCSVQYARKSQSAIRLPFVSSRQRSGELPNRSNRWIGPRFISGVGISITSGYHRSREGDGIVTATARSARNDTPLSNGDDVIVPIVGFPDAVGIKTRHAGTYRHALTKADDLIKHWVQTFTLWRAR